jgi:hypothetical protein
MIWRPLMAVDSRKRLARASIYQTFDGPMTPPYRERDPL